MLLRATQRTATGIERVLSLALTGTWRDASSRYAWLDAISIVAK